MSKRPVQGNPIEVYEGPPPEGSSSALTTRGASFFNFFPGGVSRTSSPIIHPSRSVSNLAVVSETNKRQKMTGKPAGSAVDISEEKPAYPNQDRVSYNKLPKDLDPDHFKECVRTRLAQLNGVGRQPEDAAFFAKLDHYAQRMGSVFSLVACLPTVAADEGIHVCAFSVGDTRPFLIEFTREKEELSFNVIKLWRHHGNLSEEKEREAVASYWEELTGKGIRYENCPSPGFYPAANPHGPMFHRMYPKEGGAKRWLTVARSLGDGGFPYVIHTPDEVSIELPLPSSEYFPLLAVFSDGAFESSSASRQADEVVLSAMIVDFLKVNPHFDPKKVEDIAALLESIRQQARARGSKDDFTGTMTFISSAKVIIKWDGHGGDQYADIACRWLHERLTQDCEKLTRTEDDDEVEDGYFSGLGSAAR